jgi:hypothetical protein
MMAASAGDLMTDEAMDLGLTEQDIAALLDEDAGFDLSEYLRGRGESLAGEAKDVGSAFLHSGSLGLLGKPMPVAAPGGPKGGPLADPFGQRTDETTEAMLEQLPGPLRAAAEVGLLAIGGKGGIRRKVKQAKQRYKQFLNRGKKLGDITSKDPSLTKRAATAGLKGGAVTGTAAAATPGASTGVGLGRALKKLPWYVKYGWPFAPQALEFGKGQVERLGRVFGRVEETTAERKERQALERAKADELEKYLFMRQLEEDKEKRQDVRASRLIEAEMTEKLAESADQRRAMEAQFKLEMIDRYNQATDEYLQTIPEILGMPR